MTMRVFTIAACIALGIGGGCNMQDRASNEAPVEQNADSNVDQDNTAMNERDRSDAAKTPINQNENQKDIDITADIRSRVVDTEMSTNAHNVKIITQAGKVTLRGPVKSSEEKAQIDEIATKVAGKGNVINELDVE
ncbi:putative hyperosmotically inducible periplasmic protein [Blastopirellula marina DSM 3645]|uniref:Putative hyperosmotically inducible periplasmic protein n=2 Tax=Blastopirellula marina TaxID=124 RepID=A3ZNM6_9BACT|nr:putative hyperosmotically inducible periplasmic protein [Blastopirellula marina DSM 3645]